MYIGGYYYKNIIDYIRHRKKKTVLQSLQGNITPSSTLTGNLAIIASNINKLPLNVANGTEDGTVSCIVDVGTTTTSDTGNEYAGSRSFKHVATIAGDYVGVSSACYYPCTSGTQLTASLYVKNPTDNTFVGIAWYDSGKSYITSENTPQTPSASYVRVAKTSTAPANTAYAQVYISSGGAQTFYTDNWQLEIGGSATDWVVPGVIERNALEGSITATSDLTGDLRKNNITDLVGSVDAALSTTGNLGVIYGLKGSITGQSNIPNATLSKVTGASGNLLSWNLSSGFEEGNVTDISYIGSGGGTTTNLLPLNVANGSETGTVTCITDSGFTTTSDNTNAYSGNRCFKHTPVGAGNYASITRDDTCLYACGPGTQLTASLYAKNPSGSFAVSIYWLDSSKTYLSSSAGDVMSPSASYQRAYATGTAPSGTAYAEMVIGFTGAQTTYTDNWQLEIGGSPTTFTLPGSKNLLPLNVANGTEDGNVSPFSSLSSDLTITSSTEEAWEGSRSLKAVWTGSDTYIPIRLGGATTAPVKGSTTYQLTWYQKGSASAFRMWVYDQNWTTVGYTDYTGNSGWTRHTVNVTTGASSTYLNIGLNNGTTSPTIYVDGFQLEEGASATAWALPGDAPSSMAQVTVDSSNAYSGSNCIKVVGNTTNYVQTVGTGLSHNVPVTAGNHYSAQAKVKLSGTGSTSFGVVWTDANYNVVGTNSVLASGTSYVLKELEALVAPVGAVYAGLYVQPLATAPDTKIVYLDELRFESGDTANEWGGGQSGSDILLNAMDITATSNLTGTLSGGGSIQPPDPLTGKWYKSVKDYGPAGQGGNDTAIIQAAIADAKNVYFPAGQYRCNLNITSPTFNLLGAGVEGRTQFTSATAGSPVITVNAVNNNISDWSIKMMTIVTEYQAPGLLITATNPYKVSNGHVSRLRTARCSGWGVETRGVSGGEVRHVKFTEMFGTWCYGNIRLGPGTIYCIIEDYLDAPTGGQNGHRFQIEGDHNLIKMCATEGTYYNSGNYNTFINCINESVSNDPPTDNVFTDIGNYTVIDQFTFESPPSARVPIAYYAEGVGHLIKKLSSYAGQPATPIVIAPGSSGTFVDVSMQGQSISSYNYTGKDFANWQLSPGGSFFAAWRKKEIYGSSAPGGSWSVGDRVYNTAPTAGGNLGWVYTSSGWKTFGNITA